MAFAPQTRAVTGTGAARAPYRAPGAGAAHGLPLYLQATVRADRESEAGAIAAGAGSFGGPRPSAQAPSAVDRGIAAIARQATGGQRVPDDLRGAMEGKLGVDLGGVRLHDDGRAAALTRSIGADALTVGDDIFFAPGRLDGGGRAAPGRSLLSHELTHVAQQAGAGAEPQVDAHLITPSLPVPEGVFSINMRDTPAAAPGGVAGMRGTISFRPDPHAPYSAEIELQQIVNTTDVGGATTPTAGAPVDWRNMNAGQEAPRMTIMTPGTAAGGGWFVDARTDPAVNPARSALRPYYRDSWGPGPDDQPGWVRSPTDVKAASLFDAPNMSFPSNFDFETVAKGNDNQRIYGSLFWGFQVRAGAPTAEYAVQSGTASANVQAALNLFRDYYTHEPTIIYFDVDVDTPMAGEAPKIAELVPYMTAHTDVTLELDGFADETGPATYNVDLSRRRAANVQALIVAAGVTAGRITRVTGNGETHEFAGGAPGTGLFAAQPGHPATTAGTLRANRRVRITFVRGPVPAPAAAPAAPSGGAGP